MWRTAKLGEVANWVRGLTYSKKDEAANDGIAVLRATNIDLPTHKLVLDEIRYVTETVKVKEEKYAQLGDLLVCTASGSKSHVGKVAIVEEELEMAFGGFMAAIRCNERCYPRYLYHVLTSQDFKFHLKNLGDGANINNLKFSQIKDYEFPIPPIAEQQRIVAKLDAAFAEIDRAVKAAKRQQEHLARLSAAVLTFQLFRKSWATKPLSDVLQTGAGGTPLKSEKHFYDGGNIPWLLSGAVCEKDITESKTHITEEGLANSSAKLFPAGTVLVAMYGATAGQVGILRTEAATNQAVCGIYPHQNFLPEFLFYYFTGYKSTLLNEVSGVAQPNLSQAKIRNVPLPVISVSDQRAVVKELDSAFSKIEALTDALSKKQNAYLSLKSAILAQELQPPQSDAA